MQQGHDFRRFGYQPLNRAGGDSAPRGSSSSSSSFDPDNEPGMIGRLLDSSLSARLRSPMASVCAIAVFASVFGYVIYSSYPPSPMAQEIPIIKAEATPIRIEPQDGAGEADILYRESTVFDTVRQADATDSPQVENLLDPSPAPDEAALNEEAPLDKEAALAAQEAEDKAAAEAEAAAKEAEAAKLAAVEKTESAPAEAAVAESEVAAEPEILEEKTAAADLTETSDLTEDVAASEDSAAELADAAPAETTLKKPQAPAVMHEAGASPETLAFVRSVLDKKDGTKTAEALLPTAQAAAKAAAPAAVPVAAVTVDAPKPEMIEPASGTAVKAEKPETLLQPVSAPPVAAAPAAAPVNVAPAAAPATAPVAAAPAVASSAGGTHFVQLSSITNRGAADAEWKKLQSSFTQLSAASFRVQEANLDKGTFFRIQAGPFSEAQAKSVCESIKAQKPGGCFVVR